MILLGAAGIQMILQAIVIIFLIVCERKQEVTNFQAVKHGNQLQVEFDFNPHNMNNCKFKNYLLDTVKDFLDKDKLISFNFNNETYWGRIDHLEKNFFPKIATTCRFVFTKHPNVNE